MATKLLKSYFVARPNSSSSAASPLPIESSAENTTATGSTPDTSMASSVDSHELSIKPAATSSQHFRTSGFTAINSASSTPNKKVKDSMSPSESSVNHFANGLDDAPTVNKSKQKLLNDGIEALDMDWSLPENSEDVPDGAEAADHSSSRFGRAARNAADAVGATASTLGKRARGALEPLTKKLGGAEKENRRKSNRLQELDERDELEEDGFEAEPHARKTRAPQEKANDAPTRPRILDQLGNKNWEPTGLYVGQTEDLQHAGKKGKPVEKWGTSVLPMPMFMGRRLLTELDRDFNLPYDVFSPLQAKQPRPEEWKKTRQSEYF